MSASSYGRAKQLFLEALARTGDERAAFVAGACGSDAALRRELESLLGWHDTEATGAVTGVPGAPAGSESRTRFATGEVFAGRYRIVSWLGAGGIGDVWRAHDTVLDVPVALKLFHESGDASRRRLLNEARLARQITHPSVCRVFDVGEAGGDVFLSMEFVDGEDLSSLLRRVGRLPPEKVIEIAQHLCGALAAAHAQGVLHRDLKPANILIDARGRVRITDFGIATAGPAPEDGFLVGTPGYMAPEQLVPGGQLSERTDLYALGLVLFELVTGVRALDNPFAAAGSIHVGRLQASPVAAAGEVRQFPPVPGMPAPFERVILQAMAPDPRDRPSSALAFAAQLPGVNAASIAIEAGLTPSPALVAASPDAVSPQMRGRTAALVAVIVLAVGVLAVANATVGLQRAAPGRAPDAQVERADEMLKALGYTVDTANVRYGFIEDPLAPEPSSALLFWLSVPTEVRSRPFVSRVLRASGWLNIRVHTPLVDVGEIRIMLDRDGRLVFLEAPSASAAAPADANGPPPWPALLAFAGVDPDSLSPAADPAPPGFATARAAWTRPAASPAADPQLIEAAAVGRVPVYFSVVRAGAGADARLASRLGSIPVFHLANLSLLLVVAVAAALAIRNTRRGSAGWVDARRIALLILAAAAGQVLLTLDYPPHPLRSDASFLSGRLIDAQVNTLIAWVLYLGLEPIVRRRWPDALVSWTRAIAGQVRDVRVGWALLVGAVGGLALTLVFQVDVLIATSLGLQREMGIALYPLNNALAVRTVLGHVLGQIPEAVYDGLLTMMVFALIRWLISPGWWGVGLFMVVRAFFAALDGSSFAVSWMTLGLAWAVLAAVLIMRVGLLGYVVSVFTYLLLRGAAISGNLSAWYAERGLIALLIVVAIGVAGFVLSRSVTIQREAV